MRMLEAAGIAHEVREYDISMEAFSAEAVAELIGVPASRVFKTLLATGERTGACFAAIPADTELDLKALARAAGDRRMSLVPLEDVEPMTGYRRGGVTAIGARKELPVYLDLSAAEHDIIGVSGGVKGVQVMLTTDDYVAATGASLAEIARSG
jgi:Cys-tRNA(Pro)/Cys-tRNA(Cys) deacylase